MPIFFALKKHFNSFFKQLLAEGKRTIKREDLKLAFSLIDYLFTWAPGKPGRFCFCPRTKRENVNP